MRKPTIYVSALALGVAGAFVAASPSFAVPITYTEQVTASGSLDGTAFTDASVVLTMHNDTANVIPGPFADQFQNVGTTTVSVSGVGTDTFTDTIIANAGPVPRASAGFYDRSLFRDILFTDSPVFATYELGAAIGPVADTTLFDNPGLAFPTAGGALILNSAAAVATFTATTSTPIPESSSLALLGAALGGLGLIRHRRKRGRVVPTL